MTVPPAVVSGGVASGAMLSDAMIASSRVTAAQHDLTLVVALQDSTGWPAETLMASLGERFAYPVLTIGELRGLRPTFEAVTFNDAVQRQVLIAHDAAGQGWLLMANPFDGGAEDWALRRHAHRTGHGDTLRQALVHPSDLRAVLAQQEQQMRAMDGFNEPGDASEEEEVAAVITLASIGDDTSPVVKLVNSTLYDALKLQASDIHLECDAGCLHVLYRVDGVLVPITSVQGQDIAEQIISRVKVMAELDIAERRTPQDGRFKVRVNGRQIDFRVSVMPNIFGEDAVLRLLDRQSLTEEAKALRLDNLGLDAATIASIRLLANKPHGMLLVTGPTGSGKTTTLYGAISEIHTGRDKIITIEDPVEYRLPRVLQIPVNEKKGLTFARGLRSILRHDPDKIMVGEIRDEETAQIAMQAALTGHLVLTTVHANNVFDVLGRFLHMGVDAYSFAAALNGIVAQRLLRINCPHCDAPDEPSDEALSQLGLSRGHVAHWTFRRGRGCGHCRGVGYKGRRAVAEVLTLDDRLRELIAGKAPISVLKERATQAGLRALRDMALQWVSQGVTTLDEVVRVAG